MIHVHGFYRTGMLFHRNNDFTTIWRPRRRFLVVFSYSSCCRGPARNFIKRVPLPQQDGLSERETALCPTLGRCDQPEGKQGRGHPRRQDVQVFAMHVFSPFFCSAETRHSRFRRSRRFDGAGRDCCERCFDTLRFLSGLSVAIFRYCPGTPRPLRAVRAHTTALVAVRSSAP